MLYTGKGDGGTTKVFGCDQQRISKASELPEALGALDELNSFLGLAKVHAASSLQVVWWGVIYGKENHVIPGTPNHTCAMVLKDVQETLFIIQAETAGAEKRIDKARVERIEVITNAIEKEIPPIKSFSIAGGTELSAMLDVARTLARRAERRLVAVADTGTRALSPDTKAYMNRLSSLLFALARFANHKAGVSEENPHY